jgi:hypothetical protein
MPPASFESALSILIPLVSAFFPDVIQQIHSLRARGVMSSQTALALGRVASAFPTSAGILCIAPEAFAFMMQSYQAKMAAIAPLE